MDFDELKHILMKYGEQLDENDLDLFQDTFVNDTGKIIVDGIIFIISIALFTCDFVDFIKKLNPMENQNVKKKKGAKKGSGKKK